MTRLERLCRTIIVLAIALCAFAGSARAALENSAPADATVFLKLRGPYAQFEKFLDSALFETITGPQGPPDLAIAKANVTLMVEQIETEHGFDLAAILRELFAREAALVRLGDGRTVFLLEGNSPEALAHAATEFMRLERAVGRLLDVQQSDYKGVAVHSSTFQAGADRHHALMGDVLAFAPDMDALLKVIDVHEGDSPALAASETYREARAEWPEDAVAMVYADVARMLPPAAAPSLRGTPRELAADALRAVRYAAVSATAQDGLTAQLTLRFRDGALPLLVQPLLAPPGSRLEALKLAPDAAAIVLAGSLRPRAVWEAVLRLADGAGPEVGARFRAVLSMAIGALGGIHGEDQFFDEIGGQVVVLLLPLQQAGGYPEAAVALELRDTAHIPLALETLAGIAAIGMTADGKAEASIEYATHRRVPLATMRFAQPAHLQAISPTLCTVGDYLVVSSTVGAARSVIDAFKDADATLPEGEGTVFGVLRMDVSALSGMLEQHREFLVRRAVEEEGKSQERAEQDMAALKAVLSFLDYVEATVAFGPDWTRHVLKVKFAGARD